MKLVCLNKNVQKCSLACFKIIKAILTHNVNKILWAITLFTSPSFIFPVSCWSHPEHSPVLENFLPWPAGISITLKAKSTVAPSEILVPLVQIAQKSTNKTIPLKMQKMQKIQSKHNGIQNCYREYKHGSFYWRVFNWICLYF